jgi:hypothetical protein
LPDVPPEWLSVSSDTDSPVMAGDIPSDISADDVATVIPFAHNFVVPSVNSENNVTTVDPTGVHVFYYLYVDSLTYAFGWSTFLCRIRFCDTLVINIIIIMYKCMNMYKQSSSYCRSSSSRSRFNGRSTKAIGQ